LIDTERDNLKQIEVSQRIGRLFKVFLKPHLLPEAMRKEVTTYYNALCEKVGKRDILWLTVQVV
jgi:hypothetical protein